MDIKIRRKPSNSANTSTSLLKAVRVLQCFSFNEPELGIADILRKVDMPRTTVHRILSSLLNTNLLERDNKSGRYRIGPALYMMGSLYLGTTDIITAAEPVTRLINELTGEYVKLSVFDRGNIVVIKKEESRNGFRYYHNIGTILPAYASAMGKAFLSELTETELDNLYPQEYLIPLTNKTITSRTQLKKELEQIKKTGVSYDFEGNTEGLIGIASVIKSAGGKVVSAICTGTSTHGIEEKRLQRLSEMVILGARVISYRLGYQDSQSIDLDVEQIRVWWERNNNISS